MAKTQILPSGVVNNGNFTFGSVSANSMTVTGLTASTALALDSNRNLASVTNTGSGNNVLATSPTISGVTLNDGYTEEVFTITDGAAVDLNPANGSIQLWTLGDNRNPTADNFLAGQSMTLMIDDGTAYSITWPSVTWVNNAGVAPTLATTGYTVVALWKVSTTLYGALVGNGT